MCFSEALATRFEHTFSLSEGLGLVLAEAELLVVTGVKASSQAEAKQDPVISQGNIILRCGDEVVKTKEELVASIQRAKERDVSEVIIIFGTGEGESCAAKEKRSTKGNKPPPLLKTSFGLKLWKGVSTELLSFVKLFAPLASTKSEAHADRLEAFELADPNGNGLCSLSELETYVLQKLMAKFPRKGKGKEMKEPGRDIWDAFRPCYIRAFKDAADWAYDDNTTISGTKNAKQDDFVSFDEFRIFNA